jgi:inner membrane protein
MMASTHVLFGLNCWLGYAQLRGLPLHPEAILIAGAASLLPDIDHPKSTFGSMVPFLSRPISAIFGHRGITHSLFAILAGIFIMHRYGYQTEYVAAIVVGYLSHLAGDMLTNSGVPLLWPVKSKIAIPVFSTGGFVEWLVRIALTALLFWIVVWPWLSKTGFIKNYL